MKILIFGGTGAMGIPLVEILAKSENDVYVTTRRDKSSQYSNIHYIKGNAHDNKFIEEILKNSYDVIIDFMVYSEKEFQGKIDLLLDATAQYIYLSSSRVYAESIEPLTENSLRLLDVTNDKEYLSTDEYALSKARQENLLFNSKRKNWTIVRPYITFGEERLQLGIFEKEDWLNRALNKKTIVVPKDILEKTTTITYGEDVSLAISKLIGNKEAYGEAFHIVTGESKTWKEILELYRNNIKKNFDIDIKINVIKDSQDIINIWNNKYQVIYDRLYNRKFSMEKFNKIIKQQIEFTPIDEAINKSLVKFKIEGKKFKYINPIREAYMDKKNKELTMLRSFKKVKDKIKYLISRYLI